MTIIQMTREDFEEKYGYTPFSPPSSSDINQNDTNNTTNFSDSRLGGRLPIKEEPRTSIGAGVESGKEALKNVIPSAFRFGKGLVGAVLNPIETAKGVVGTGVGAVQKLIPGEQKQEKYADAFGQYFKERYGSLENASKTAQEDPFGFGVDVLSLITGGAGLAGKAGTVSKAIPKVAQPLTRTAEKFGDLASSGIKEVSTGVAGITTGAGKEAFSQALKGGDDFTKALRGEGNLTDILNTAKTGLKEVKKQRGLEYTNALEGLSKSSPKSLDISAIGNKANELLQKFDVKKTDKGLDFSRSSLVNDQTKVNAVLSKIRDWGSKPGDRTVIGVDKLKQQIRNFREPNNPTLNAFIDTLSNEAKSVASQVKGYKEFQGNYEKYSVFINELEKTFSLKAGVTPDTAINKISSLLRDNSDYRRILADELKRLTGKDIVSPIAGQALSQATPKGLAKYVAGGVGISMPHLIPVLALSSPRLMGEFFRIVGITARDVSGVLKNINEFRIKQGVPKLKLKDESILPIQGASKKKVFDPTKQGGFIKVGKETPKEINLIRAGDIKGEGVGKGGLFFSDSKDAINKLNLDDRKVNNFTIKSVPDSQKYVTTSQYKAVDDFLPDGRLKDYFKMLSKEGYIPERFEGDKRDARRFFDSFDRELDRKGIDTWTHDGKRKLVELIDSKIKQGAEKKGIKLIQYTDPDEVSFFAEAGKRNDYVVLDKSIIKTDIKSKPTLPQSKVNESVSSLNDSTLIKEAKKYKSADEFVKAKQKDMVYHGSNAPFKRFDNKKGGAFFTDDMMNAEGYAGGENVYEGFLDLKNPLVIDAKGRFHSDLKTPYGADTKEIVGKIDQKKYDGVIFKNIKDSWIDDAEFDIPSTIYYVFKPEDSFINESQLEQIWKQANKK